MTGHSKTGFRALFEAYFAPELAKETDSPVTQATTVNEAQEFSTKDAASLRALISVKPPSPLV